MTPQEKKEKQREYMREYNSRPENKEKKKEYESRPENKEKKKEYNSRPERKEKKREYKKEYDSRPEIKEKRREYLKEYESRPENKEKKRARHLKRHYGISVEEYERMLCEAAGRCAVCGEELLAPHVDHNHKTGKIRGLLCPQCNIGLGMFNDSAEILAKAASYLRSN